MQYIIYYMWYYKNYYCPLRMFNLIGAPIISSEHYTIQPLRSIYFNRWNARGSSFTTIDHPRQQATAVNRCQYHRTIIKLSHRIIQQRELQLKNIIVITILIEGEPSINQIYSVAVFRSSHLITAENIVI